MATMVISPHYEYGNLKSSNASTHKGHSLLGRKSPVNHSNQRRNSNHSQKSLSSSRQQSQIQLSPPPTKISNLVCNSTTEARKLERALSEPVERRSSQSNSSRYKTELCRPFEENGTCKYGDKCQFAHGIKELRTLARHPKYKTELCRTFHSTGLCPYGPRCHFIHNSDQTKTNLISSLAMPNHQSGRPKALSSSSLGSTGDISPPSSNGGTPTMMRSFDELFQLSSNQFFPQDFTNLLNNVNLQQNNYFDYTTHEFNPEFYDTPNVFQESVMSSVFGSSPTGPQLDNLPNLVSNLTISGNANLDLYPQSAPETPNMLDASPNFLQPSAFNFFLSRQD